MDDGCSGGDDGTTHDEGCGGSAGGAGGDKATGKGSRVGQILLAKVKDLGSPGLETDHITWKWFAAPTAPEQLAVMLGKLTSDSPDLKLCKKTILGGNLVVHAGR